MKVTIVGSGDAFGSGGRFNTCFMVETQERTLLMDFGASSPVALKAQGHDPDRIDAVILSHLHGDHFGGVPFLLLEYTYDSPRKRPLTIVGPPGTERRIFELYHAGKLAEIREYNLNDVRVTRKVYERIVASFGR